MFTRILLAIVVTMSLAGCFGKSKEDLYKEGLKQLEDSNANGAIVLFKNALEKDENYLDARFQLARAYSKAGKLEQAEKEFNKVLKQNPSRDDVVLELANVLVSSKKGGEAMKLAGEQLAKNPRSVEALEIMGIASAVINQIDDAERYLLQAIQIDPARVKSKLTLASLYVSTNRTAKAKALLEDLVRSDPKNPKPQYMLAAIESMSGNSDRALEMYTSISANNPDESLAGFRAGLIHIDKKNLDKADRSADELVTKFPKRAEGPRLKGLVSYHRNNFAEAIDHLQNSVKIAPTLEAIYFLGLSFYNRGELESALSQFRRVLDYVPDSRQARLMTGSILLAQKRFDDAHNEIMKILKVDDRDALAHNLLGSVYMGKGMFAEGMSEFNKATRIDPKSSDAYLKKGFFYLSIGKSSEGESELTAAVHAAPDAINNRLMLASLHLRTSGGAEKALGVLRGGLTGAKGDAPLYNSIAAVYFTQNKIEEGLKSIQKAKEVDPAFPASYNNLATHYAATGRYDKAIEEYRALLGKDSKNPQAILGLAVMYEIKGDDREALSYYEKGTETKQTNSYMAKASYHIKKKETSRALKTLEDALKVDPRNGEILEMKGRLLVGEKKFKDAIRVFEEIEAISPEAGMSLKIGAYVSMKEPEKAVAQARRIIEKQPKSARGYMILASVHESQKDFPSAINEIKNGLRVDPGNAQAILYLGNLYVSTRDYGQAMNSYQDAYRKKPDFIPALFAQGALHELTGKFNDAIAVYKLVLDRAENYAPALNNLAYLYASGYGSKEEALRLAIAALRQEPGNPGVVDTLGFALLKNNRLEDAVKVLERAENLMPDNPTVIYHLAVAYKESGKKSESLKMAQKAVSLGQFPEAKEASALVAELKR